MATNDKQVRITSSRAGILELPTITSPEERDPKTGAVTKPSTYHEGRTLRPGGNNIDADYWAKVKDNPTVQQWTRLKYISVGGDTSQPEGVQAPQNLEGMDLEAARAAVASETDRAALERYQSDSRAAVREAASKRLYEVNK